MTSAQSIGKNIFHLFCSTAFSSGLNALTLILMANHLDAGYYGMFSIALAYAMVMGYFTDTGMSVSVLREGSKKKSDISAVLVSYIKIRLVLFLLTLVVGGSIIHFTYKGESLMINMIYALVFPMVLGLTLQGIGITYFQLMEQMHRLGMIRMLSAIFLVTLTGIGMLANLSAYKIGLLYGSSYLLAGVCGIYMVSRSINLSFKKVFHKGLFDQMTLFIISGLLIVLMPQLGPLVLEHTLTLQQVGFFAIAYRIPSALYQIPGVLAGAVYPALFKHYNNGRIEEHFQLNMLQLKSMALIGMAMTVSMYYSPETLIRSLFGDEWVFAAEALRILSFILVLQSMNIALADGLTTKAMQKRRTIVQGAAVLAGLLFYVLLSRTNGLEGAAYAAIFIEGVALIGFWLANPLRKRIIRYTLLFYMSLLALSTVIFTVFLSSKPLLAMAGHLCFLFLMAAADPSLRQFLHLRKERINGGGKVEDGLS